MFIPLAPTIPTTSTPSSTSSSTPPLDDGITTVKHYIYIQTNLNPRTDATAKSTTTIGMTTSNANPTVSTTTPVITDVVQKCVDTTAEATTSTLTTTAGMTSNQIASTTSTTTTIKTATSSSNTVPMMAREAHRYHTVFAPMTLVESLTKTNLLLVADVKSELQSMNKQLSKQSAENLETRMEALEQGFIELREVSCRER